MAWEENTSPAIMVSPAMMVRMAIIVRMSALIPVQTRCCTEHPIARLGFV